MNFLSKCLIFFLNVLIASTAFPEGEITLGPKEISSELLPKKRARAAKVGPHTYAAIKLKANWQVIGSLGKGAKMTTTVETYAADGLLFQSSPQTWLLKIAATDIPVSFFPSSGGIEPVVFAERGDLLRLFDIELTEEDRLFVVEHSRQPEPYLTEGVRMVLGKTPSRQLDAIYRSPGEGLFLVKASLSLAK